MRGERPLAGRHLDGEGGCGLEQLEGHALPLRTLAGKEEGGSTLGSRAPAHEVLCPFAGRQRREAGEQILAVLPDCDGAPLEVRPRGGE